MKKANLQQIPVKDALPESQNKNDTTEHVFEKRNKIQAKLSNFQGFLDNRNENFDIQKKSSYV